MRKLIIWGQVDAQATKWDLLKKRLMVAFPSCSSAFGISYYRAELQPPKSPDVFLLKLSCHDTRGLLHAPRPHREWAREGGYIGSSKARLHCADRLHLLNYLVLSYFPAIGG